MMTSQMRLHAEESWLIDGPPVLDPDRSCSWWWVRVSFKSRARFISIGAILAVRSTCGNEIRHQIGVNRERQRVMEYLHKEESALVGHDGDYRICKSGFTRNKRWVDHWSKTVLLLLRFNQDKPSTATWDLTDSSRLVEISSAQRAEIPSVIK